MRVVSLIPLPESVAALFASAFQFTSCTDGDPIIQLRGIDADALLCSAGSVRIDANFLSQLPPSIRAIATYSVGYDHVDLAACAEAGVAVFNTPDVLAESVADAAMLLMLGAARRATESIALIREGRWTGWTPTQLIGTELRGKTLGILGLGGIGRRIARRARAFGMRIAYSNRRPAVEAEGARFIADPQALLAESDVFLLACPSTAETRRFIRSETLAQAKPSLILVNVGRGDLVDDDALIEALSRGRIQAAGLDVFDGEPHFDRRYLDLPNMFMLPHIGSSTREARIGMGQALVSALEQWSRGSEPANRIV